MPLEPVWYQLLLAQTAEAQFAFRPPSAVSGVLSPPMVAYQALHPYHSHPASVS